VPGGGALKGLVFLTILITVAVQGFSAPWLAQSLDLLEPALPSEAAFDAAAGLASGLEQQPGGEQVGTLKASQ